MTQYTYEKINAGFKTYSVSAIIERIRWDSPVGADGIAEWKINNNFRAFYARKFMTEHPEYSGFFRTRTQISQEKRPTNLPPLRPKDYDTYPKPPRQIAP